jgi:hypothetical protein
LQPLSLLSSFTQDHHGLHSKNKKTKDHIVSNLLLAQDEHNTDRVILLPAQEEAMRMLKEERRKTEEMRSKYERQIKELLDQMGLQQRMGSGEGLSKVHVSVCAVFLLFFSHLVIGSHEREGQLLTGTKNEFWWGPGERK